jgi:ribose 5-phosphate isomerase A
VIGFGARTTISRIEAAIAALGYGDIAISLRMAGDNAFRTDSGNLIFDCAFGAITDAPALARTLSQVPGVVDHGLFIGVATTLIIARADGIEVLTRKSS